MTNIESFDWFVNILSTKQAQTLLAGRNRKAGKLPKDI